MGWSDGSRWQHETLALGVLYNALSTSAPSTCLAMYCTVCTTCLQHAFQVVVSRVFEPEFATNLTRVWPGGILSSYHNYIEHTNFSRFLI